MCRDRATDSFAFLTHSDQSDSATVCYRVADVVDVAKLAYYAARLIVVLGG